MQTAVPFFPVCPNGSRGLDMRPIADYPLFAIVLRKSFIDNIVIGNLINDAYDTLKQEDAHSVG